LPLLIHQQRLVSVFTPSKCQVTPLENIDFTTFLFFSPASCNKFVDLATTVNNGKNTGGDSGSCSAYRFLPSIITL
jgi:hypothetical protein